MRGANGDKAFALGEEFCSLCDQNIPVGCVGPQVILASLPCEIEQLAPFQEFLSASVNPRANFMQSNQKQS